MFINAYFGEYIVIRNIKEAINMELNHSENNHSMEDAKGVFYLDGLFFISENTIKKNTDLVKNTFQDLYKSVSYN